MINVAVNEWVLTKAVNIDGFALGKIVVKNEESPPVVWDIVAVRRLALLDDELKKNKLPFLISIVALIASVLSIMLTRYWAIIILATLPFTLHYAEHEITLLSAKTRVLHGKR